MTTEEHPNPERWWRHRRWAFWAGIVWAIAQTPAWVLLALHAPELLPALTAVIGWSYAFAMALVLAYFGNTTAETWRGGP